MTEDQVEQAIADLIERYGIDADAALALITRLSMYYEQPATEVVRRLSSTSSA